MVVTDGDHVRASHPMFALYVSRIEGDTTGHSERRAREAAATLTAEGTPSTSSVRSTSRRARRAFCSMRQTRRH